MSQREGDAMEVWRSVRLARAVHRYGLFEKTYLIAESLLFPTETTLRLARPLWKSFRSSNVLVLPVITFDREVVRDDERVRETLTPAWPSYVRVGDFGQSIREAAFEAVKGQKQLRVGQ